MYCLNFLLYKMHFIKFYLTVKHSAIIRINDKSRYVLSFDDT